MDIAIRTINVTLGNKHYILQNQRIDAADGLILNLNITMNASVILAANSSGLAGESNAAITGANVSISAFGVEIS